MITKTAYEIPSPFQVKLLNNSLLVEEGTPFLLMIQTVGSMVPNEVSVVYDGQEYVMRKDGLDTFMFEFSSVKENISFFLKSNSFQSPSYELVVSRIPVLEGFEMQLIYPPYTKRGNEVIKNTGNALVPEGTFINWKIRGTHTKDVLFISTDSVFMDKESSYFHHKKQVFQSLDYGITTSNDSFLFYENLRFQINVVKDQFPVLNLSSKIDSVDNRTYYFHGELSDDYGLSKLELFYYPTDRPDAVEILQLPVVNDSYDVFFYTFPEEINLSKGVVYDFYFQVTDNDVFQNGKVTKSKIFTFKELTDLENQRSLLNQQEESLKGFEKGVESFREQELILDEIRDQQKQDPSLTYQDRKNIENFFKQQQFEEQMMNRFTNQLKDNLAKQPITPGTEELRRNLQERLERQQLELERNEELLKQLEELSKKLDKEELQERMDQLAKQRSSSQRNLEQLLELTKRMYVSQRMNQIKESLTSISERQSSLSQMDSVQVGIENQREINTEFNDVKSEINTLRKENSKLIKPLEIPFTDKLEQQISRDQEEVLDRLKNPPSNSETYKSAKQKQNSIAQKLNQMAEAFQNTMMQGSEEQLQEDIQSLRQILDNLLVFSFENEKLVSSFSGMSNKNPLFSKFLTRQGDLKVMFQHVDDSLFSLSLRRPELSENINKEISDVHYNIDKSLERLSDNNVYQAVANQQYAMTATNNLAEFLSDVLSNLQMQLNPSSGKGEGEGKGFQLPDIIQSQEELAKQLGKEVSERIKREQEQGKVNGLSDQFSEDSSEQLYRIFKQQQELRNELEKQIRNLKGDDKKNAISLAREMEFIENQLLDKGATEAILKRMERLNHQLLKLENASFEQGQDELRESRSNEMIINARSVKPVMRAEDYFKQLEILNRQVLPLRSNYKERVKNYFRSDD